MNDKYSTYISWVMPIYLGSKLGGQGREKTKTKKF